MSFRKNERLGNYDGRKEAIDEIYSKCVKFYNNELDSKDTIALIRHILWGIKEPEKEEVK